MENYTDIIKFGNQRLQSSIVNWFIDKLEITQKDNNVEECKYISGHKINLPVYFLHYKGHDLENKLKEKFVKLRDYNKNNNHLIEEILNKVVDEFPKLLSVDFLEIFKDIQDS